MTCGEKIKQRRIELGLNQTELGEAVGLKFGTISKYEKDQISIPAENLKKIANALNVSMDYLSGNTSISNPKQYLENTLSKYDLNDSELDILLKKIIEENTIDLSILNSTNKDMEKLKKAYQEILNIYADYIETTPDNIENNDIALIKEIDEKFVDMLKNINRTKIIYKEKGNAFPYSDEFELYPVLGKISAGLPIFATENIEDNVPAPVPANMISSDREYFFLKVVGDSMNRKYQDGSLVFVQKQDILEDDCIGVIMIDDEATIKKYRKEGNLVILEPMSYNPIHKTQIYDIRKKNIKIIGKVLLSVSYE